jgi:hypothetical protein
MTTTTVVDFPFVMVRFEDLLFHAPAVLQAIANCAKGYDDDDLPNTPTITTTTTSTQNNVENNTNKSSSFSYYLPKSKLHGKTSTDFVSAMIKYGTTIGRTNGMLLADLQFAQRHLQQQQQVLSSTLTTNSSSSSSSSNLMQILHYQTA